MVVYALCSQQRWDVVTYDIYLNKETAEAERKLMAAKWKHEEWFIKEYKVIE